MVYVLMSAALVLLVAMAAYLAASETALMRVSRIRVRYLAEKKVKKADKLERLIENPDWFLPTLLFMVRVVQLSSASVASWLATRLAGNQAVGVTVGTAVMTVTMFIFGELVPKAFASHNAERVSLRVTRPMVFMSTILRPLALVFEWIAVGLMRLFRFSGPVKEGIVREEGEIKAMVTAAEEHDVIEEEEREMIHSVFEFGDTMVREVMVPRPDMVTLSANATVKEALALAIDQGYSRIPVFDGGVDRIVGILYAKDLLKHLKEGKLDSQVGGLTRKAYFVPETRMLSGLLQDLRNWKVHMAMVVDEYGTVVGLVTIEDLLEEIVGEIFDEFDREVNLVEKVSEKRFRIDARLNIQDLNEMLNIQLPGEEDVDTVGGLVFRVLGHVPEAGEMFDYNGLRVEVETVRDNRIQKVVVELIDVPGTEDHA